MPEDQSAAPTSNTTPPPAPRPEAGAPTVRTWALAGIVVVIVVGGLLYWVVGASRNSAPDLAAPRTIGIAYFRQGLSSIEALKRTLERMGYTNLNYIEEEIMISPTMGEDMRDIYQRMLDKGVDLIWADHEHQAKVALEMTKERGIDIPIVFIVRFHDPVEYGLAESFKSSGNNATGVAGNLSEVTQRTLTFLKEIDPSIRKVGIFGQGFRVPDIAARYFAEFKKQVNGFGMEIVEFSTRVPPPQAEAEFNRMAATIRPGDVDAFVHIPGHFYETQESGEYRLAKRLGIPMSAPYEDLPGGGHFSYSTNYEFAGEESAVMVDKIFRGTLPSDIPVEYGARNELTLHLGRARETGVQFPDSMIFIATEKYEDDSDFPEATGH